MKKFKALYQGMYDDLKDAEMMIKYAHKIQEEDPEDKALADEIAKYAKYRLEHFMAFHRIFVDEAMKHGNADESTVDHCMWEQTHEHMWEWYEHISKKISKYK